MRNRSLKVIGFLCLLFSLSTIDAINIVPQPNHLTIGNGQFRLRNNMTVSYSDDCEVEFEHLSSFLKEDLNLNVKETKGKKADVRLILDKEFDKGEEAYALRVNERGVVITASSQAGLFYGIQTLRQLANKGLTGEVVVPCVDIDDCPRFKWRAMLLDEARTFQGKEIVKQLIREMSMLKMNKLQWHLTDDQGWRIEIKKYPLLTTVNTELTLSEEVSESQKKGYYTQEEIEEIVRYAERYHVTIVPEIEMPGHASAAIAAYPWLGVNKEQIQIPVKEKPVKVTSIHLDIFDLSDQRTITFLEDILDEVGGLFPGKIIHIGGDEVNFSQWKNSTAVADFMKKQHFDTPAELQRWLTNSMSVFLSNKGIRMMGWNDIMGQNIHGYADNTDGDYAIKKELDPKTIVHFWKGDSVLIGEAVRKGFDVVNAYHVFTYIDYDYNAIPLEKSYSFDPMPSGLPVSLQSKILGLSCQMWGGSVCTIETHEKLYKQIVPRLAAYAEVGWTFNENKDWKRFSFNVDKLKEGWEKRGIVL